MKTHIVRVNMPWTIWRAVFLFVLSGSLCTVSCGSTEVNATCSAKPAVEGQTGGVELYFNGIDFLADQIYIVLQKEDKDILHCGHVADKAVTTCTILNHDFKYDGKADANMTVNIPVVKHDLGGQFVLNTMVNNIHLDPTSCDLTVGQKIERIEPVEGPGTVVVVVPTVLAIIVVIVVVVSIVFVVRCRRRETPASPQEEHMIRKT